LESLFGHPRFSAFPRFQPAQAVEKMVSFPFIALVVAILLTVLPFWPSGGLLARWRRYRELSRRELAEHALKHLHDCEFRGLTPTLESLAGAVRVSRNRAVLLMEELQSLGLIAFVDGRWRLTTEGRRDALRVIRVHRLWEKYLADYTGVSETAWHDEADRREHQLSEEEVESLAAKMGHPRFDPHGAPIPTASGEVPVVRGEPLASLGPGERGTIAHVEDEPDALYAQLVAQGLTVGTPIQMIETTPERIRLNVHGEEQTVARVVAANVTVRRLPRTVTSGSPFCRLSELALGREGRVVGISPRCRGIQRRRLLDLGLIPGTRVKAELRAAGGDPSAYRIRGALMALRFEQSDHIEIEEVETEGAA